MKNCQFDDFAVVGCQHVGNQFFVSLLTVASRAFIMIMSCLPTYLPTRPSNLSRPMGGLGYAVLPGASLPHPETASVTGNFPDWISVGPNLRLRKTVRTVDFWAQARLIARRWASLARQSWPSLSSIASWHRTWTWSHTSANSIQIKPPNSTR